MLSLSSTLWYILFVHCQLWLHQRYVSGGAEMRYLYDCSSALQLIPISPNCEPHCFDFERKLTWEGERGRSVTKTPKSINHRWCIRRRQSFNFWSILCAHAWRIQNNRTHEKQITAWVGCEQWDGVDVSPPAPPAFNYLNLPKPTVFFQQQFLIRFGLIFVFSFPST